MQGENKEKTIRTYVSLKCMSQDLLQVETSLAFHSESTGIIAVRKHSWFQSLQIPAIYCIPDSENTKHWARQGGFLLPWHHILGGSRQRDKGRSIRVSNKGSEKIKGSECARR